MTTNPSQAARTAIGHGLIMAGLFLQASIAIKLLAPDHLRHELGQRLLGVLMGAVLVVYANAAPKALAPLTRLRCDPVTEQAIRRFSAWSLTLGGAAYLLTWAFAPYESTKAVSASFLGSSLLLVVIRLAGARLKSARRGKVISPAGLHQLIERQRVTVIDVNSRESFERAHVPGALNLDPAGYEQSALPLDKDADLVFYCSNSMCRKAPTAARRAREMGYTNVKVMSAGIRGWVATALPTETSE